MAILFMEGFDAFNSQSELNADSRILASISSIASGFGGSGNSIDLEANAHQLILSFSSASSNTVWAQFYYRVYDAPAAETSFFRIKHADGTNPVYLRTNALGDIIAYNGNVTNLATVSGAINLDTWHFIEIETLIHSSAGTLVVKVDNSEIINLSGVNTLGISPSATASYIQFVSASDFGSLVDHVVAGDNTGSDMTTTSGPAIIELLTPNGAGNSTDWTPSAGSNFENVDDNADPDDDTTYNSSSTATDKDTFTCSDLTATSGTVYAVQVGHAARRENGGVREMRNVIRSSATEATGATRLAPIAYGYRQDIFENDPNGSIDWTVTSVNAIEIGYELVT
jgi:hypothetical protein